MNIIKELFSGIFLLILLPLMIIESILLNIFKPDRNNVKTYSNNDINTTKEIQQAIDNTLINFRREVGDYDTDNAWKDVFRTILYDDVYMFAEEICGDSRKYNYCAPDGSSFRLSYMDQKYMLNFKKLPDGSTAIVVSLWSYYR